jgi:hypothetical protein
MQLLFLNGFDRSGSSMIGGLLAEHPGVAYFFQPFNRTEVHATQWEPWRPGEAHPATERFLAALLAGRVERDYLGADLFDRHSTATAPRVDRLNVVKETKLHLKTAWLRERFPTIAVRGLWRDPRGILCSLRRNGFGDAWYGERAFRAVEPLIRAEPDLEPYRPFLDRGPDALERLALVVAARTHLFGRALGARDWIVYEEVVADPDRALGSLVADFGLAPYPFADHRERDFNVVGAPSRGVDLWRTWFDAEQLARLDAVFAPLAEVAPPARGSRPPGAGEIGRATDDGAPEGPALRSAAG